MRDAAFYVGLAHERGTGVARDPARAAGWFRRAAEEGHPAAQLLWARMLAKGSGVDADLFAAHGWYTRSARAGHPVAQIELELLEKGFSEADLLKARALAPGGPR
jgi:TPR repeat protein